MANQKLKDWHKKNPKKAREYQGMIFKEGQDPDSMFLVQKGLCAICDQANPLCVDHNHDTGMVRELLCNKGRCNSGLGCFSDSIELLRRAILYLEQHGGADPPTEVDIYPML